MSKPYSLSAEITHTINDVKQMSPEDRQEIYGVEVLDNGTVQDHVEGKTFQNIATWAKWSVEQNQVSDNEDENSGYDFDDADY